MRKVMLHPVAILALVVLVLNDRVLKEAFGNVITGKLSDVAGLVVFPLVVLSIIDHSTALAGRQAVTLTRTMPWVLVVTAAVFSGVQLFDPVTAAFDSSLTAMWRPSHSTQDPTDLLALPALFVALWVARQSDLVATPGWGRSLGQATLGAVGYDEVPPPRSTA